MRSLTLALGAALARGLAISACSGAPPARPIVVALAGIADTAPARWAGGLTNIFFGGVPAEIRDSVRLGEGWSGVEFADVVRGGGLVTVYAVRFKAPHGGPIQYVVDTDGDLDFAEEQSLKFHQRRGLAVADVNITVRTKAGTSRVLPYQVLRSDPEGYVYARIAEYRAGRARLGGHDYDVRLRNASRNHPFYGPDDGTVFLIDLDGDALSPTRPA